MRRGRRGTFLFLVETSWFLWVFFSFDGLMMICCKLFSDMLMSVEGPILRRMKWILGFVTGVLYYVLER